MLLVSTEVVPGRRCIEALGLVEGNTTVAKHAGRDLRASLRNLVGGELAEYTELLADARGEVRDRMAAHARRLGADAVVAVRFTTATVPVDGAAELFGYGTAVRLE